MSLSEYLRKLALGYRPKEQPPLEYSRLIGTLSSLSVRLDADEKKLLHETLLTIQRTCTVPERRRADGGNEDMGGQG